MGPADIVRQQADAQNRYDFDTVVGMFTDNVSWTDPGGHVDGRQAVRGRYTDLYTAFPDGQVQLGRVVEQGDLCMYEEAFSGNNTGPTPLPDGTQAPATGKPFAIDSMVLIRVDGDQIAEYRIIWDQMAAMMALGLIPPPA
jgi:ketosteroid isomerase-like protein